MNVLNSPEEDARMEREAVAEWRKLHDEDRMCWTCGRHSPRAHVCGECEVAMRITADIRKESASAIDSLRAHLAAVTAERDEWRRRAEAHGCDLDKGHDFDEKVWLGFAAAVVDAAKQGEPMHFGDKPQAMATFARLWLEAHASLATARGLAEIRGEEVARLTREVEEARADVNVAHTLIDHAQIRGGTIAERIAWLIDRNHAETEDLRRVPEQIAHWLSREYGTSRFDSGGLFDVIDELRAGQWRKEES